MLYNNPNDPQIIEQHTAIDDFGVSVDIRMPLTREKKKEIKRIKLEL